MDGSPLLLRHALATIAYRTSKVVRGCPESFAAFRAGPTTRTPIQILAHMCDLFDWALTMVEDRTVWQDSEPTSWDQEVTRFFAVLERFDGRIADTVPRNTDKIQRLLQGPVADALTHTGQLAMLRRLAGHPVLGENYAVADIVAGRTGLDQAAPRREFE